ncbi:DUF2225 domain-containing protein [Leptolyngbya sp. NK1-12]|uniref:DUF2225 domain-containing protein n=1 Tax=Leptolyngbya sp. NK1-12 TaxID=2547451 RepID=A0AA97AFG3_9CYAN|nr:DUF2225 domain-containing protein [Leptolyngbya sp. NK1-12]
MGNRRLSQRHKWLKQILAFLLGVILFSEAGTVLAQGDRSAGNDGAIVAQSDTEVEADRLYREGERLYQQGNIESLQHAIPLLKQALTHFQLLENFERQVSINTLIGQIYFSSLTLSLNNPEQSFTYFHKALVLSESLSSGLREHKKQELFLEIGRASEALGRFQDALDFYDQAVAQIESIEEIIFSNLSTRLQSITDWQTVLLKGVCQKVDLGWDEAIDSVCIVLSSFRANGAIALVSKSSVYAGLLGDLDQAIAALTLAQEMASSRPSAGPGSNDEIANFLEGVISHTFGQIYVRLGDFQESLKHHKQALSCFLKLENKEDAAGVVAIQIAHNYIALNDEQQASQFLEEGIRLARQSRSRSNLAQTLSFVGELQNRQGNYESALKTYEEALDIARSLGNLNSQMSILENMTRIYLSRKDWNTSASQKNLTYAEEFLTLAQLSRDPTAEASAQYTLARIHYLVLNNSLKALEYINESTRIIESLRSSANLHNPDLRTSFFSNRQSSYHLHIDILTHLSKQNPSYSYEAFNVSERARARTLIELLAESNVEPSQATNDSELKALYERKRELEAQLSARENLIQTAQIDEIREQHQQEYIQLEAELKDNVEPQIKQKDPAYAAIRYPEPLTLDQIQRDVLDDETVLLQYAIGEQQSYLWVVPHEGEITTYTLPGRKVIEQAAKQFLSEVERSGIRPGSEPEEVKFTGDQLYSLIFQDAKTQQSIMTQLQGKKRLLIAADGILHTIPFAALPLPNTERYTPLITQYEIVNTPSASTIAILRQQFKNRQPAPKTIALLADPVFRADETRVTQQPATAEDICELTINSASPSDSAHGQANPNLPIELASTLRSFNLANIDRLPCTQLEAESILSLVPDADQKSAVFGFDANYDWMTQASSQLDQYRIVHLATHGFADEKNPELSMLVLSLVDPQGNTQNGMLRLRDIFNLKLNADMVVLSACQTGQGENVRGEGLIGITRGFMYAGAKRVVNSLWYVNDAKTAELMVRFYKGILQENLSPTAALQKAQIQMWETYKKPELWAAFTIQGEWRIQN